MSRKLRPLAALAIVALVGAGCASGSSTGTDSGGTGGNENATGREKAVKFAACMRENGVGGFPDPNASGEFAYGKSDVEEGSAAWVKAIGACKDLQPPGTFGDKRRSPAEQKYALEFAQCMRDHGIEDFPDPTPDGPLVNVDGGRSIPGLDAAMQTCGDAFADELGLGSP